MKNLKIVTLLFFLGISLGAYSQNVFSSSSGNMKTQDMTLDWSIGESVTVTTLGEVSLTQGFHQPVTICDPCFSLEHIETDFNIAEISTDVSLEMYPNPVLHELNLDIEIPESGTWYLAFFDASGKLMRKDKQYLDSVQKLSLKIDVSSFVSGQYFLRVYMDDHSQIKPFFKSF